jgi:hypothetical protein
MTFRDDREAAQTRVDTLEKDLADARAQLAGAPVPPPVGASQRARFALAVGVLVAAAGGLATLGYVLHARSNLEARRAAERRSADERARVDQRRVEAESVAAQVAADAERARLAEAQRRVEEAQRTIEEVSAPTTELVWRGTLDSVDGPGGAALVPGVECALAATFAVTSGDPRLHALTLRCGEVELYRAGSAALARSPGLREGSVFGSAAHTYLLRFSDEAETLVASADISTLQHRAEVFRGGASMVRATVFLRDVSEAREGPSIGSSRAARAPAFAEVIAREGRVTRVTGAAPVAAGARCAFLLRPVWEYPESCRVALRCGNTWLYGADEAGYLTCEVRSAHPVAALDENPTSDGGDPRLSWRGRRAVVGDFTEAGAWEVTVGL